jgi:hypothetical protein
MKAQQSVHRIEKRINTIKSQLTQLGPMRPGCLSLQFRNPKEKTGPNYQLSYTHQMRSKTDYIPADRVPQIQREVAEYKRFRELTTEWVALSIDLSRLKIKQSQSTKTLN